MLFFFFKHKTAYEMRISDWSSDVYSSDLQHVELARHALAVIEDFLEGVGAERRIAGPAHLAEAVENIRLDFLGLHRVQMMRRDHPLAKLLERRRMEQCLAEFGLAEQEYLQQRMTAELEVRQHPQLFERRDGQILDRK